MSRILTAVAACLIAAGSAGAARAETVTFNGTMAGATEVPPKTTDGKGTATASLDTATKMLTYQVDYSGLSGPATAGHFHGPAEPGANAGVVLPFAAPAASPIKGTATLTDAQMADLMAGKWYANIHTAANPGGEIRGQMTRGQ
ncbi:MAG TPA: CHRD domain-containing protein [Acetobacteraceae bacterium]